MDWLLILGTLLVAWALVVCVITVSSDGIVTRCKGCGKHFIGSWRQGREWYHNHECEWDHV